MSFPIGVIISGRGSNLKALIEACAEPKYPATIKLVISNVPGAKGLARAEDAGIPIKIIDHREFEDRPSFELAMTKSLEGVDVQLVCLAGFMRLVTRAFIDTWQDRLINIHPSLLPAFKGLDVHERVIASGARFSGCTVHFVRAGADTGPIILQSIVPVLPGDTSNELAARVLAREHECLPAAVRWIAEGRIRLVDEVVKVTGAESPPGSMNNPSDTG